MGLLFSGQLVCASGPATSVCSTGTLTNANCAMNEHAGSFVVCAGNCSAPLGGSPSCNAGPPVASGGFTGSCLGACCSITSATFNGPAVY